MAKKINVKLILELRSAGMGRNAIAASRHISKNSVGDVFHIADRMGISYEDIAQMDEDTVYRKFYPDKFALESLYDKPDYEYVHQELKRTGVTLKLLWQEYQDKCRASGNIPMGYTKYCQGYSEYTIVNKLTNHLEHKPGVAVEVDWSGPTMTYVDTSTGGISKLKIPHQSHADFCSTDTAGGLDNKKRRYAPPWRRGAYRLFLWGFPKGACPHWHTTLLAKCSVLYLLAWLTGETGCGASCTPFAPAGKQAEFLRMGMSKKSGCFQRTAAGI